MHMITREFPEEIKQIISQYTCSHPKSLNEYKSEDEFEKDKKKYYIVADDRDEGGWNILCPVCCPHQKIHASILKQVKTNLYTCDVCGGGGKIITKPNSPMRIRVYGFIPGKIYEYKK